MAEEPAWHDRDWQDVDDWSRETFLTLHEARTVVRGYGDLARAQAAYRIACVTGYWPPTTAQLAASMGEREADGGE